MKGSTITDQVETSSSSDDGGPEVWQGKVGQEEEKSLRAPAKMESLEGAATCELEGGHSVMDKKKVDSAPLLTTMKVFLIVFT